MKTSTGGDFAGWWHLVRFVVRRDRTRLVLWIIGLVVVNLASAAALPGTYPDQESIDRYAELFGSNPALVAFAGPGYGFDNPNIGVILVNETQVFALIGIALMSIFLIVHGTRAEEDTERADLIRSNPVGRHAPTASVLAVVAAANAVVGGLSAAAFVVSGYSTSGSVALGASFVVLGWVFLGVAIVAAQVMSTARGALGLAGAVLGAAFIVRAVGDIGDNGMSWASPMGWAQGVRAFAGERWWTLGLCVAAAVGLVAFALALANIRDLGSGIVSASLGPPVASRRDTTAIGFAFRLLRGSIAGWTVGMLVAGVVFGSLTGDIEQMVEDNPVFEDVFVRSGGGFVDSYLATMASMLALVAAGFAVAATLRPRGEESSGHAEQILATAVSRNRWMGAHLLVALVGTVAVVSAGGVGAGAAAASVTGQTEMVGRIVGSTLVTLPAILVLMGFAALLYGVAPRAALSAWVALAFMAIVGYLGRVLGLPEWVFEASPMEHVPAVPAVGLDAGPLVIMGLVAAALVALGLIGFSRRDLAAT